MNILHLLNWHTQDIINNIHKIKEQGFTAIQISPVQPTKSDSSDWWNLYQPTSFSIGNRLGKKEQFIELCNVTKENGIDVIVDVVLRHLASKDDGSLYPHELCDKNITSKRDYWLQPIEGNCNDRYQEIHRCFGLPALNYFNEELINTYYKPFLQELLTHAQGIRIDEGKHFALPYEGGFHFWNMIKEVTRDKICYGECINLPRHILNDYCNYTMVLTDKWNLPSNSDNAIVFHETHDTYHSFGYTKDCSDYERLSEHEYNISHFSNTIFFARPFDVLPFSDKMREINQSYS